MSAKRIIIAPSILSADPGKYSAEIKEISAAGADWIHIDVMDGSFVPPITFGDNIVKVAKHNSALILDTHLMVANPEKHFQSFKDAGADRLTFHLEATDKPLEALKQIRAMGIKNGISVKPNTPAEKLFALLDYCDLVLIMTVEPGWGGQKFIEQCLPKIEKIKSEVIKRNLDLHIEVDGGINPETAKRCRDAGANAFVAGSYVFGDKDRGQAITKLRQALS